MWVIDTSLSLLLYSICAIETVMSSPHKIRFSWEDLKAKKYPWSTDYPVISMSELQLLDR